LILFERTAPSVTLPRTIAGKLGRVGRTAKGEIVQLRRKLSAAEDHLRSLVESKEASDEEYQSANEEILSANEELQSTNEELETSKEELQSANEELNTVNDELLNRNVELDRLTNDLSNLLNSTTLPVVMVDRALRIRRVTALAAKTFKTLSSDIGRPISDIRPDINVPDLSKLIAGVIDTLAPAEMEVQDKEDHWYSLQIRPYRTQDDKIDGAILVLSDIDVAKQESQRVKRAEEFMSDILDTVREPLLVLDLSLKVLYSNPSFLKAFSMSREETNEKLFYDLRNGQWNIPKLREMLKEVITKNTPVWDFEVEHTFPPLGTKTMLFNARRVEDGHTDQPMMLLAIEDITERKQTEQRLRESEERFRMMADNISQLAWTCDRLGNVTWYNQRWLEYTGLSFEAMKGWDWSKVLHPDHLDRVVAGVKRSAESGEPWDDTFPLRGKDGTYRWFLSRAVPIRDASGKIVRWFGTNTDVTAQRSAEESLREAQKLLERSHGELELLVERRTAAVRKLSADIIRTQDEERRKISRELHDSVGQYLAYAKMSVEALKKPGASERETQALSHVADTLEKCLTETRTISHLLHPPLLDEVGFASAAQWYAEGFSERSGIRVNLIIPPEMTRLSPETELVLFRVLQESLTNIHRHSGSQSVDIQVQLGGDEIRLEVRDFGRGIPPELLSRFRTTGQGVGVGMNSMRERVSELGGWLEIQSDKKGTLIRVAVPLSAATSNTSAAAGNPGG
ncbi:MAG TPA: PAS domain-containing protein, partial [Candidatus Sulfotelmatobacter sp.]|nr:PAS domain-containing protein [Candidatus Sulfotelmatobacter sp.]